MERPCQAFLGAEVLVFGSIGSRHVPAGAARRDNHLAGTARSGQGRAGVWRGEANPSMRRSVAVKGKLLTRFAFFPFAFLSRASSGR